MTIRLLPKKFMAEECELVIETDLTDEEKEIIARGEEEYKKGGFVPFKPSREYK
ncbi:MAG: hypothetical protein FWD58_09380 [Firmicutes bacterium]|nr:hypothetical protein [Bacillota bacterium]